MTVSTVSTTSKDTQAAAVIVTYLRAHNRVDRFALERELYRRRRLPAYYVQRGVRKVRDAYGDNALVTICEGGDWLYVLDPELDEGLEASRMRVQRIAVESEHALHDLDWLAATYGNSGVVRRARRYARNLSDEVSELVDVLGNGA